MKFIFFAFALMIPVSLSAHPGNTDSSGCHTCKTNCPKWGLDYSEYHCHASKGTPQPMEPVRRIKSETGTGITVPAPEYKNYTPVEPKVPTRNIQPSVQLPTKQVPQTTKTPEVKNVSNSIQEAPVIPLKQEKKRNAFSRFIEWLF